jgi:uncharacterized protein (UPF0264 family)
MGFVPVPFNVITSAAPVDGVTVTVAVRDPVELAAGANFTVIVHELRAPRVVPPDPLQVSDSVKSVAFVPPSNTLLIAIVALVP